MDPAVLLTIGAIAGLTATLTIAVWRALRQPVGADKFDEALAKITGTETLDGDTSLAKTNKSVVKSWNEYWRILFEKSGRRVNDPSSPGRVVLGILIVAAFFGIAVFPGGALFPLAPAIAYVGITAWLSFERNRRKAALEKQLPLLLSGLRNQMQAGTTVQGAIMAVADDLPLPLGDEIRQVKADVNVSVPLDKALNDLAARSQSSIMQFLVSSMGVAIRSGSDLIPQLIVIEETVRQRARIQGKIRAALALARPTAYIAAAAPIAMAAYMFFTDPTFGAFYMTPEGLLILTISALLYGAGLFTMRILVSNVEKV